MPINSPGRGRTPVETSRARRGLVVSENEKVRPMWESVRGDAASLHRRVSARRLRFFVEVPVLLFVRPPFIPVLPPSSLAFRLHFYVFVMLSVRAAFRQLSR